MTFGALDDKELRSQLDAQSVRRLAVQPRLEGRRVLLVLDGALDAEQVMHFKPLASKTVALLVIAPNEASLAREVWAGRVGPWLDLPGGVDDAS